MKNNFKTSLIFILGLFFITCKGPDGPNLQPIANAGADILPLEARTVVILDGGASSDTDGNDLYYQWTVISTIGVDSATLSDDTSVSPTLSMVGFDSPGDSVSVQLIVSDGKLKSLPDTVLITHSGTTAANNVPVADAGADITTTSRNVNLDGGASSDADGDSLTYEWSIVSAVGIDESQILLLGGNTVAPSLQINGTWENGSSVSVQLIVNDGEDDSLPSVIIISYTYTAPTPNSVPVANAGADIVTTNTTIILDGGASTDADGDALTYSWEIISTVGLDVDQSYFINGGGSITPTLKIEGRWEVGSSISVRLIVNDGTEDSTPDAVIIKYSSV